MGGIQTQDQIIERIRVDKTSEKGLWEIYTQSNGLGIVAVNLCISGILAVFIHKGWQAIAGAKAEIRQGQGS